MLETFLRRSPFQLATTATVKPNSMVCQTAKSRHVTPPLKKPPMTCGTTMPQTSASAAAPLINTVQYSLLLKS